MMEQYGFLCVVMHFYDVLNPRSGLLGIIHYLLPVSKNIN